MRAYVAVKGGVGIGDDDWAIVITNLATRQTSIPSLAFPTREKAQAVVDAICRSNPAAYTNSYPWTEEP